MVSGGARKLCVYFFWGGYAQEEEDGTISYQGGSRDCVLIPESMSLNDLKGRLLRRVGLASEEDKLWYTLKFDRKIFLPLDIDDAVEAMFMGNEEHAYVYLDGYGGPVVRKKVRLEVGIMAAEEVSPYQTRLYQEKPTKASEQQVQLVMPDGDVAEQRMIEGCNERADALGKRQSAEADGARGPEKQRRICTNRDSMSINDVTEHGRDLSASGGESNSSSSGGSGMDEQAIAVSGQSDNNLAKKNLWKKEIVGVGQVFASSEAFRNSIFKYAIAHKFEYKFTRNCRQRIVVQCTATDCPFEIVVRGSLKRDMVVVKNFKEKHVHDTGDECEQVILGKRRLKASMLAQVIEGKIRVSPDYSPVDIMKDMELELGVKLTYTQSWRARERVRMMVQGRPDDQYKVLPWMCEAICRANPGSTAICELDGSSFKRLFVAYAACINGFKYCRPVLVVGGTHLNGPCKGVMLAACGLDADNHLLNFAYAIVSVENNAEWSWFLEKVSYCLGELRPVIVSERIPEITVGVEQVFGKEYHSYCVRHMSHNFLREASKHGLRKETTKHIVNEMFKRVAYATNGADYDSEMEEVRRYKPQLADWIETNEPERWAASKFPMNRWGCVDTSILEDWNKWMQKLRSLPIPCIVTSHLDKLVKRMEKNKQRVSNWVNGVGPKIETTLKEIQGGMGSVVTMQRSTDQVYTLSLSNWQRVVVDLGNMGCTCFKWQMNGLPCAHAMVAMHKLNLSLYDYLYNWYKAAAQRMVYNEEVHPMKTHAMPSNGLAEGGDDLNERFLISMLPPNNEGSHETPQVKSCNSKSKDRRAMTCSKCREVGHTRRSCKNSRANSDTGNVVGLDELFGSQ